MRGRFLALEGPDGVGKTTLARHLAPTPYEDIVDLDGRIADNCGPLVFVSRRQIPRGTTDASPLMRQLATMLWHSGDPRDLPDSFWVPLQAAWFTAHATTVVSPLLDAGHDVLVDGWTYKFFSKLLLQGYTAEHLTTVFGRVLMPDAVVLLKADPGALFDRRRSFRPAELGMHGGYDTLSRQTFVDYQTRGMSHLLSFATENHWPVVDVDPDEPPDASAQRIRGVLDALLPSRQEFITPSPASASVPAIEHPVSQQRRDFA